MTGKLQTIYTCSNCGAQFPKWSGRCLECGKWGSLDEEIKEKQDEKSIKAKVSPADIVSLNDIEAKELKRIKTKISEFDRVLGGGLVPGSLILLSGEPGIGKSTLVGQIAASLSNDSNSVIYVSGEESAGQLKERFDRIKSNFKNIGIVSEVNIEKIISTVEENKPKLVIIDSIQTIYSMESESDIGSVSQIRACTVKLLEAAKRLNISILLIGHITKDGMIAGPKTLEHIVDTVIYLETETNHNYRILKTTKNRFGSINEIGVFEMTNEGFREIKDPSLAFIDENTEQVPGSVVGCIIEGTRPFLVEIQALVTKTIFGYPQRKSSGIDINRLQVLSSVLIKRSKINLTNQDIILNVVGGMKLSDPGLDLAICLAIITSLLNQKFSQKTLAIGEVGLGGEIRGISKLEDRINEAARLGYKEVYMPNMNIKAQNIKINKVKNIKDIIDELK